MVNTLNKKQPKCFPIYSIYNWISTILLWYTRVITDWTFPVPATTPIHLADHKTFHQSSVLLSNRYQTCKITQSHQNLQETWGRAPNKFLTFATIFNIEWLHYLCFSGWQTLWRLPRCGRWWGTRQSSGRSGPRWLQSRWLFFHTGPLQIIYM